MQRTEQEKVLRRHNRQLQKAVRRKNKYIYRLRCNNSYYLKWCYKYGTDPKINPWVKNTGIFPIKIPFNAWIDVKYNNGEINKRVFAVSQNWDRMGLPFSIDKWRFHNSREKAK